mgnify:CR=1 FL=1
MLNFAQNKLEVGSKNKLKRFSENETFSNVFQPTREEVVGNEFPLRGKWNSEFFKNDNPIVLELGCGKGEYSVGLAERFPEKNFIGIDIKGARFWRGAKTAVESGMNNVAFVRTQIELINHIFTENEVTAQEFMDNVDTAAVYHNASTRFTDGGQFGLGGELAISTDKLHQRGPIGLQHLVTNKWYIYGDGQIR